MPSVKRRRTPRVRRSIDSLLLSDTKYRAKRKGIECTLTRAEVQEVLKRSKGRCELTGIRFDRAYKGVNNEYHHRPFKPSLDRIDAKKGYTLDNVRVVLFMVNTALSEFGERMFERIARAYLERRGFVIQ